MVGYVGFDPRVRNRRDETILVAQPRVHGHRDRQLSINCKFAP
jgi:hypothetical protein